MRLKSFVFVLCLFFSGVLSASAQTNPSKGLKVYLHPNLAQYAPFSHVCRLDDGKHYYAVLGANKGTVFVDYTDNKLASEDIQFFPGAPSNWRECRSYNDAKSGNAYVYVVTEGPDFSQYPGGIQIFRLRDGVITLANTYTSEYFNSSHTIAIDTKRGWAFVNGSRWQGKMKSNMDSHMDHMGGLRILDIATDPEHPHDLGFYKESYTHDSYALGEVLVGDKENYIIYLADIYKSSIHVLNVEDPANPELLGSVYTPLNNQGIGTHNVWASEDKKWLFATEETPGSSLLVYDISDPSKPRFVTCYRSNEVRPLSIIHNIVVRGHIAYCSWYREGIRLIDIADPLHPREIAYFDSSTHDFPDTEPFHGNWSVDVDDRGIIMISDIEEGLFILRRKK